MVDPPGVEPGFPRPKRGGLAGSRRAHLNRRETLQEPTWPLEGAIKHPLGAYLALGGCAVSLGDLYPPLRDLHRPGLYKCYDCRRQFTVTVGTIFERSKIPLRKWVMAFHMICSSKKGISALQLQRNLGLGSYKTAWFMAHRIRHAMRSEPLRSKLQGVVEADETWIGGRRKRKGHKAKFEGKTPVVALIERGGRARSFPVKLVNAWTLSRALREHVDPSAHLRTDESNVYTGAGKNFASHETVNHSKFEYLRGDGIHSNSAESYFALLKRGVHGTFHHISKQHMHRYCDEFSFRWTFNKVTDGERTVAAVRAAEGKRLMYKGTKAG